LAQPNSSLAQTSGRHRLGLHHYNLPKPWQKRQTQKTIHFSSLLPPIAYYGISTNFGTTILRLKYSNFEMACLLYGSGLILIIPGMFLSKKTTLWCSLGGFFASTFDFLTYFVLIFSARPT
jgi:hypothetical protein